MFGEQPRIFLLNFGEARQRLGRVFGALRTGRRRGSLLRRAGLKIAMVILLAGPTTPRGIHPRENDPTTARCGRLWRSRRCTLRAASSAASQNGV